MYIATAFQVSLDHWMEIITTTGLCYFIGSAIFNLYLSPLARYPGPFLCKISSFPDFYWSLTGTRHLWIAHNQKVYGDVFRYRPDGLLFKTPRAYRDIFNNKANVKRSKFYDIMTRHPEDTSTLTGTDPVLHAQKRRVLNSVFSEKSIRSMEPLLAKHVNRWCELLVDGNGHEWSSPRKMSDTCDHLVLDVLCDLCFGRAVDTKEPGDNEYRKIPHIIAFFLKILYPLGHSPWLNLVVWLKPRGLDRLLGVMTPPQMQNLEGQQSRNDMLQHLINAVDPVTAQRGLTPAALEAEVVMLTIAGSDTTSVILAGFFFYITRTPHAYAKIVSEIRSTFTSFEEIKSGPKLLSSCRYMRACVDETMRITPAGPSELPRIALPGGLMIDGAYIPEGVTVGVSHWSFYRNEDYFKDPDVYRPERWIVDPETGVTEQDVAWARSSCVPFAAGTTSCAGKNFALLELYLTIVKTLWLYDMRLLPGDMTGTRSKHSHWGNYDSNVFQVADSYISMRDGPMVQFRKRT
ncbi:benzoate 4-monooxygenase cytochrome P450 [Aspergillus steynii IBT 23096]|uniref:Benzoate 4-monooxygenase cytochrome P450 n=1 Tax=Aspergillus steynii IBT 23096 TaxID=1392250 RepID=A0A2I2G0S2_9EURO|nr:benzoate 4-monooxygenase cytochrome P450 [Aspergillus steynii IBT 23096]PLB46468.1 benzoate 4-monooxygenase cytochrome P450 [Aspergillus steynii IBT 23096]